MIEVIDGGMLSTVQDLGCFGVMKNGFSQCGAMDAFSFKLANKLCGNDLNAAGIEMTMKGITVKFTENHVFALSGGDFASKLNDVPIKTNKAYQASKGDILSVGYAKTGMRSYLAVAGGIDVPLVMGSASTNIKLRIGGFEGRRLKKGDIVKIKNSCVRISLKNREYPDNKYDEVTEIRVVLGPQDDMFTKTDLAFFLNQRYTVTPSLDRMGIRLNGIALRGVSSMDIISDAITFGSVQITQSGYPIILMADHQTTGGYAKIATVISVDLSKLAQMKPYDKICFRAVTVEEAERLAVEEKNFFKKLFRGNYGLF